MFILNNVPINYIETLHSTILFECLLSWNNIVNIAVLSVILRYVYQTSPLLGVNY